MTPSSLTTLNAIQLGVLVALVVSYGVEALRQRHRAVGLLVTGASILAVRHLILVFGALWMLPPVWIDRLQSPFAMAGFVFSIHAMSLMVGPVFPRSVAWISYGALGLNVLRVVAVPAGGTVDVWLLRAVLLVILTAALGMTYHVLRAAFRGDPIARSLSVGLCAGILPVLSEAGLRLATGLSVPLSGFAYMLLSLSMVNTWVNLRNRDMLERAHQAERESAGWRGLLPGPTFRLGEENPWMEQTFGPDWTHHLEATLHNQHRAYRVHQAFPGAPDDLGWVEELPHSPLGESPLLQGWSVGLGLDERDDPEGVQHLLEAWGARVQPWGVVPPRQGPFPSLLLWSREPSILAVWREDDLSRRRCRWIQVGGAEVEGPHARLDRPLAPEALRETLRRLLSFPSTRPPASAPEDTDGSGTGPWPL